MALDKAKGGELENRGARVKGQDPQGTDNLQLPTRHIKGKVKQLDYIRVKCPKHGGLGIFGKPALFTRSSLGVLRCQKCGRRVVEGGGRK